MATDDTDIEPLVETAVDAFDEGTVVSRMSDGSVQLRLPLMPPSWASRAFDTFQTELASALGVEVVGLDRELFCVPHPRDDTVERMVAFLAMVRARG
jgi:hypothetical protein